MQMRNRMILLATIVCMMGATSAVCAAEEPRVFTDPEKAGADFQDQGEYLGTVTDYGDKIKIGVQVIALGDGNFRAYAYVGGLPGAGWDRSPRIPGEGARNDDGLVVLKSEEGGGVLSDGKLTVTNREGREIGVLKKIVRKSPTLGLELPKGAVVLFDGTSPDAFEGGRMTDEGLLMEGATSKQKFQSFQIHLEFRTPFQPFARGQGRGNSGFYAQGRYEVQILDSFGLEGMDNECGGIYSVARPRLNMCFPPLSWQTYDVVFHAAKYEDGKKVKNARMTVIHNGVMIHKNQEIPHATTAAPVPEGPEPGPIFLQNHGNPVRFRNISVLPLDE